MVGIILIIKFSYTSHYKTCCHCLKLKKDTVNVVSKVTKTKNKTILLPKYAVCGNKKLRFVKEQGVKGILCSLDLKTPLNKIPLLRNILL